ncbi:MAG: DUF1080 domain-containing protein [Pirellulaceae bacterium]
MLCTPLVRVLFSTFALVVLSASGLPAAELDLKHGLTEEQVADGWIALFDGETTFGWNKAAKINWSIQDGVLEASEGEIGLLATTAQFADFDLRLEFYAEENTNSGIFIRTPPKPQSPTYDCYEINIAPPTNSFPTGSIVGRQKATPECPPNTWHTMRILAEGDIVTVELNGEEVTRFEDPNYLGKGFIGLQHNEGLVRFRNVHLKPLNLQSIFNGKDLTHWKEYPEMESEFSVDDEGHLRAINGPGQLETEESYGNFLFQLQAKTHAKNLNSGVFFRCIPGDKMMGYESQIHNGYEAEDRTLPLDAGTGAIFRRTVARKVVADDEEWFTKTILVDGAHISVWVNGYQVTAWNDPRDPDPNPRRGLRTEPGTIMLQGHDPTTDLSFRNFLITELPGRWPSQRKEYGPEK